jgi:hypothetical protein
MCVQVLNLSSSKELASHHDSALLQPAMNAVGICSSHRKRKHVHSGTIDWPQLKRFQHQDCAGKVYELIAEHTQLFEHNFCDLLIVPITKLLLVGGCDFFYFIGSLIFFAHNLSN